MPGNWRFDQQVSASFDSHVRKSVPLYDEVQHLVTGISEYFVHDGSLIFDVGCSTGETLLQLAQKHAHKENVRLVGLEQSPAMVERARAKCARHANIEVRTQDATAFNSFEGTDLVVALYTLQFIAHDQRARLVQRIHDGLRPGGAFIMVEKTDAGHPSLQSMWNEIHWDYKKSQGLTDEMILEKARSLRGVLRPLSRSENLALLSKTGFQTCETFIQWLNWTGFIAIRELSDPALRLSNRPPPSIVERHDEGEAS